MTGLLSAGTSLEPLVLLTIQVASFRLWQFIIIIIIIIIIICNNAGIVYFRAVCQHYRGKTEGNHENSLSG
jgi:hypothetical protein